MLGPNGSGKSSLLHALSGLVAIRAGRIALASTTLDAPSERCFVPPAQRRTSMVFQDYRLFGWLTVRANLEFAVRTQTRTTTVDATDIAELLTRFGGSDRGTTRIRFVGWAIPAFGDRAGTRCSA